MFDMNQCNKGDELISTHGMILTYVGKMPDNEFPHLVMYPDGAYGSRTNDGYVGKNKRYPEDHDIVGFYKETAK